MQFIYTIEKLQKLTDYCWPDYVVAGKDFPPSNETPWCEIRTNTKTYRLLEGQHISKTKNSYKILKEKK